MIKISSEDLIDYLVGSVYEEEDLSFGIVELPEPLKKARNLETSKSGRLMRASELFIAQAKMLKDYEDDFSEEYRDYRFTGFQNTYQKLNNLGLRAYFAWRTNVRRGIYKNAPGKFLNIYMSELVNLIGCDNTRDALSKMIELYNRYDGVGGSFDIEDVLHSFVVYHKLDPSLVLKPNKIREGNDHKILSHMEEYSDKDIYEAVKRFARKALEKSKFCKERPDVMEFITADVLRGIKKHFDSKRQRDWESSYLGSWSQSQVNLFDGVICFCNSPKDGLNVEFTYDKKYFSKDRKWYLRTFAYRYASVEKLESVMKTIDSMARDAVDYGHKIKPKEVPKWIITLIKDAIKKWKQSGKQQRKVAKIKIDLSKLSGIRSDAAQTREKLLTEEEMLNSNDNLNDNLSKSVEGFSGLEEPSNNDTGFDSLSEHEKRYLQCLIKGTSVKWISKEGVLPSLLCDSINNKLYDLFEDTVLENGSLVEDYTEELKKGLSI